ncbi:biopolymer transporter ExbD [Chitinophaga sp. sic0106]|uniref:ExbD/TolR family protein n=1 Tax=Chitinophaga sp. sic0106 TaxID=2854785 RepID=UPI001C4564FB|nr:biopolymer transporter ExbD [Chitinophaga sp. sic0106]MBV7528917.1 biopolymer transporter ExbD [Chitinophaga sp. sic0106]
MAEMNNTSGNRHEGKRRSIKKSTRVDMTPMVDLGFLLITFFMLTTTMAQPKTLNLLMPRTDGEPMKLGESKALTVILGPNNRVVWYEGMDTDPQIHHTSFANKNGIRDILISKKAAVMEKFHSNDLMVLIKADKTANYKNLVDIMDEMLINKIDRYAVTDITPQETAWFSK